MSYSDADLLATLSTSYCKEIHAIIFDCDGVLVDTEYLKFLGWQKALATQNIELSIEEYKMVAGHSSKKILQMLQTMKGLHIPEEMIPLRQQCYQELQKKGVPPIKEMVAFAQQLSEEKNSMGIKLGLASSAGTKEILFNLKQVGLENAFDLIISGSDDLGSYHDPEGTNKPKPYIYLEAAKLLQINPEHCLVYEDTEAGIESATAAGMIGIAVPNWLTKQQNFSKASKILYSSQE